MDLKILLDTPPWDWPKDTGRVIRRTLADPKASESDRLIAAELAGDFVVINDELANALLTIVRNAGETEQLRATAAISLGPILEHAEAEGFEIPDEVPITKRTFHNIQNTLHKLYLDQSLPKLLRRRILEASVRSPQTWHKDAVRHAYSSGDRDWILTAVFSMIRIRGFDAQILASLKSTDLEILCEAVDAAGNWELQAAWPDIVKLLRAPDTPKPLLITAIGAAGAIHPTEASEVLISFTESEDEDIAEAAEEAIAMADTANEEEGDEDEDGEEEKWVN
jgi:hypothetical protein